MTDLPDENEIEVPIVDESPVEVVLEGENAPGEAIDDREAALKEMKAQLEEVNRRHEQEKIARMRAEQYAMEQAKNAQYTQADLHQSNLQVVTSGIENMQQTIAQAKRAFADANAAGDHDTAAEANSVLTWAYTQLNELNAGKRNIERYLQSVETTEGRVADQSQQYAPPAPPPPATPEQQFDAMLNKLTPKSAAWLREHPNAAQDLNKLSAAHQAATVLKGITPETPEYFSFIESELGMSNGRSNGRKPAMASAPVSSSAPVQSRSGYNGGSTMTLSAAEVEQAQLNEPELPREKAIEIYARSKAALIREGKMG